MNKKDLELILDQLKQIAEIPKLFITNYFIDLKSQVDLTFVKLRQIDSTNDSTNTAIWLQIINKINDYEILCLKQIKKNNLFISETLEQLNLIETKLNDGTNSLDLIKQLIQTEEFNFKKFLFINRTILFLFKDKCKSSSLFNANEVVKLILIMDDYITDPGIDCLKNSKKIEPLEGELTYEWIKLKKLNEKIQKSNQIDEIYLEINDLKVLDCHKDIFEQNSITFLSIEIKTFKFLSNLIDINLFNNSLTVIQDKTFEGLINLQDLKLSFNSIHTINSKAFHGLNSLKRLYLNNNKLTYLELDQFKTLTKLEELYLYSNQITSIDKNLFNDLNSLQVLSMAANRITFIDPHSFQMLNNLIELDLRYNKILSIDSPDILINVFKGLKNLKELYLPSQIRNIIKLLGKKVTSIDPIEFNG